MAEYPIGEEKCPDREFEELASILMGHEGRRSATMT
jgi:hypothetical protein